MNNTHHQLRDLMLEIPMESSEEAYEKMKCILVLYAKVLASLVHEHSVFNYFGNLHSMSFDIKSIRNRFMDDKTKTQMYLKSRNMLIMDLSSLIKMTEPVLHTNMLRAIV